MEKTGSMFMTQTVLIETLWNVNDDCLEYGLIDKVVLIETLWNVNCILPECVVLELPY